MSKKILTLGILLVVLAGVFVAPVGVSADHCKSGEVLRNQGRDGRHICVSKAVADQTDPNKGGDWGFTTLANAIANGLAKFIGPQLMRLSTAILGIAGMLFDMVIKYTVIDMATNLGPSPGIGGSITAAWETLRDIANMFFIFVLLFTAFKAMFELNFASVGTAIRNIIIVALLINFSLFFSKVVIDASNIVSVGFYKSIIAGNTTTNVTAADQTISTGYMNLLGLQSWWGSDILNSPLDGGKLLLVGIMTSIFVLITAVILLISAIMFIARFIILIFLMILSPLALIAFIVPAMESHFTKWKDALISQSFFAPLFFALTWVVFKIGSGLKLSTLFGGKAQYVDLVTNAPTPDSIALVLNYVLIIGLSIAALVFSKMMASSTAGFSAITNAMGANKVAGVVGGVSLGGAAAVGRRTIGAAASRLAESQGLSRWAARSAFGQKVKEGIEKTSKSSFDIRQTKAIGGALQSTPMGSFGTGKAGGYDATLATQIAKKEKVAAGLKTDADRRTYAIRQADKWRVRQGSRSNGMTVFGAMGRNNRIVASRTLNNQIQPLEALLQTQRDNLTNQQNTDTNLNQQLVTLASELQSLIRTPAARRTPQMKARMAQLTSPTGPVNNLNNQIAANNTKITNTNGQITYLDGEVTNLRNDINRLGINNPNNPVPLTQQQLAQNAGDIAAGRPPRHVARPARADEQNY